MVRQMRWNRFPLGARTFAQLNSSTAASRQLQNKMALRPVLLVALALVLTWACCAESSSRASVNEHSIRVKRGSTVQDDPSANIAAGAFCGKSADEVGNFGAAFSRCRCRK